MHIGIDYGSKLAGTTAICFEDKGQLHILQCTRKQSADNWLQQYFENLKPACVFIDAPLSLPGVYLGRGHSWFYRTCDKQLGAMSPMFLGGLTARAMQLSAEFPQIAFYESYPAALVRYLFPEESGYKKHLETFMHELEQWLPMRLANTLESWHQTDALLAWLTGWRHQRDKAIPYGDKEEGLIWV